MYENTDNFTNFVFRTLNLIDLGIGICVNIIGKCKTADKRTSFRKAELQNYTNRALPLVKLPSEPMLLVLLWQQIFGLFHVLF